MSQYEYLGLNVSTEGVNKHWHALFAHCADIAADFLMSARLKHAIYVNVIITNAKLVDDDGGQFIAVAEWSDNNVRPREFEVTLSTQDCNTEATIYELIMALCHEMIHVRQIRKVGWFSFYISYLLYYFAGLLRYGDHGAAYYNIPYESEAFNKQYEPFSEMEAEELGL